MKQTNLAKDWLDFDNNHAASVASESSHSPIRRPPLTRSRPALNHHEAPHTMTSSVAENNLLFAVPKKGRLHDKILKLLEGAGLEYHRVRPSSSRNGPNVPTSYHN